MKKRDFKLAVSTQIAFAVLVSALTVIANATQVHAAELATRCFELGWFDDDTETSKVKLLNTIQNH